MIMVRSDSERVADPEPTIGGEGRRILVGPSEYAYIKSFVEVGFVWQARLLEKLWKKFKNS